MTSGICLTLGAVHLLVWLRTRKASANGFLSLAALASAATALLELNLMHAQTPGEYGEILRWMHVPVGTLAVSLVWFIRVYLQTGRIWLAWLICGLRALLLSVNFLTSPNASFLQITSLKPVSFLGETLSIPVGLESPWRALTKLSTLLLLVYTLDAAIASWRQGNRWRAMVLGGAVAVAILLTHAASNSMVRGIWPGPCISISFLVIVLAMAFELSVDLVRSRQLSDELRESELRISMAAAAANLGIWEWDIARDEVRVNDVIRERYDLAPDQRLTLDDFMDLLHPDDREAVRQLLEYDSPVDAVETECRTTCGNGTTLTLMLKGRVERDNSGKPVRVRGVSADITDRRRADDERAELRAQLEQLGRVSIVNELATSLAHEINQPLGAVLRNAEAAELFLQQDPPDYEEVRAILADIREDDRRAALVIERIRALMKHRNAEMKPISLEALLEHVKSLTRSELQAHRVALDVDTPPALPLIQGDVIALQQLLLNLILNARDAMADTPADRRTLILRARCAEPEIVEVAVCDSGCGLPDTLRDLFSPFASTKPDGIGVGLSISRTIVEAHGGKIWAENNPEGGATFRFTLTVAG